MNLRLFFFWLFVAFCFSEVRAQHRVILISIDGLQPAAVADDRWPLPFLHQFRDEGFFVPEVQSTHPSMTYPAHTTIITGVPPREHGIHCNRVFQFNRKESQLYHWYADSIRAKTLWQAVKEKGGTTASLQWPVSTGCPYIDYNVPEYFSAVKTEVGAFNYLRPYCTPSGFLKELEEEATGRLSDTTMRADSYEYDAKTAYMVNYIENRYKPDLLTVHFITTDYKQHQTGPHSRETQQAFASVDNAIGLIVENLTYTRQLDSVTLVITGDHGFVEAQRKIYPNVWLVQAGMLSDTLGGNWQACFHALGAASYLYVNPTLKLKQRKKCIEKVIRLLEQQPDSIRQWYDILTPDSIALLGGDPQADLCLSTKPGAGCGNNRTGNAFLAVKGGMHGYMTNCTPTCLILYGAKARQNDLPEVHSLNDVFPLVEKLLK
ncbi:MAG: alkaline phosphatase family protein [Bacteroidales bacterium]|nr:alkaline phosphatase family protein [Bacteroidales bacterium]